MLDVVTCGNPWGKAVKGRADSKGFEEENGTSGGVTRERSDETHMQPGEVEAEAMEGGIDTRELMFWGGGVEVCWGPCRGIKEANTRKGVDVVSEPGELSVNGIVDIEGGVTKVFASDFSIEVG